MSRKVYVPAYRKIKEELAREIEQQALPANSPFLSEKEAISRFSVSRVTIRQAFDLLEQEGYIYRVQGKGSFIGPHDAKPTKTVAFIATCILSNGIESVLLRSIEDYLDKQNYNLIICNNNNEFDKTENYIRRLIRSKVDAIIYICVVAPSDYDRNSEFITYALNNNVPVVLVDRYVEPMGDKVFMVTPDNFNGSYAMAEHLVSLGHSRFGFIGGFPSSAQQERLAGIQACLKKHGMELPPEQFKRIASEEDYRILAMRYSMMKERPTALFSENDNYAYGVIDALGDFNIDVPADMAVVGFDDFPTVKAEHPVPLTTVRVPLWEEGQLGASLVVDLLRGRDIVPTHVRVPCELVVRESCGVKLVGKKLSHASNKDQER